MQTDLVRKKRAIMLRKSGLSIKAIASQLAAAQSSVSIWTREVILNEDQKLKLKANTHSKTTIEKRRQSRLKSEFAKRQVIISTAKSEIFSISPKELLLICSALYWAEGGKRQGMVVFSNGDPRMIQLMLKFFREICNVNEQKLRGYIHIHENLDVNVAERYWQKITKISSDKFYPTYNKPNKSSKGTRNSLPYGVCDIYVLDAKLLLRIKGWIEGIYEKGF